MDPRNNAEDAYTAFVSMEQDEWRGLLASLNRGGVLQPEEHKGFLRALRERGDFVDQPQLETVQSRLQRAVLKMLELEQRESELEEESKRVGRELKTYREQLVPQLMEEIGFDEVKTSGGAKVIVEDRVFASFPSGQTPESLAKQTAAMGYLRETGNDGLLKREFIIRYGREGEEWAQQFAAQMEAWGVEQHAQVEQRASIHNATLVAFLKRELAEGRPIPLEAFGAFVQRQAKVKV